jgi:hypothetical protein
MWTFTHEQIIDAQPEVVFDLICDFPSYSRWNPFVIEASGPAEPGGVAVGKVRMGSFTLPYQHKIFEFIQNKSVCWRDFGFVSLFYCGQRCRYIETDGEKTHYKCELQISGPLSGLVRLLLGRFLRGGIVAETQALVAEAESVNSVLL